MTTPPVDSANTARSSHRPAISPRRPFARILGITSSSSVYLRQWEVISQQRSLSPTSYPTTRTYSALVVTNKLISLLLLLLSINILNPHTIHPNPAHHPSSHTIGLTPGNSLGSLVRTKQTAA